MTGFWGACTYDPNAVRPFTTNAPTNFTIPVIGNVTNNAFGNYTIQDLPIPVIGNFTNTYVEDSDGDGILDINDDDDDGDGIPDHADDDDDGDGVPDVLDPDEDDADDDYE